MGRKSAAAIATEVVSGPQVHLRPDSPYELTDAESNVWRGVVDSMPANWFTAATYPLLVQYCRHVANSHRIAQLIEAEVGRGADPEAVLNMEVYNDLLMMQNRESAAIARLSTKMRIAQQSTIAPDLKKKGAIGMKLPWQVK